MNIPINIETLGRRYFTTEILVHDEYRAQGNAQGNAHDGAHDKDYDKDYDRDHDRDHDRNQGRDQVRNQVGNQVIDRIILTLEYCRVPKTKGEILENLKLSNRSTNFKVNVFPAIDKGLLEMTIPDKPKSKHQKYITTEKGKEIISKQQ
jgi:hypothetical protein